MLLVYKLKTVFLWWSGFKEGIKNNLKGVKETFSNPSLGIGFLVSVILHLLVIFLFMREGRKEIETRDNIFVVEWGYEKYNPKVEKIIKRDKGFMPGTGSAKDDFSPLYMKKKPRFQARVRIDDLNLKKGATPLLGENVLRINPDIRMSTEEILVRSPINLKRGLGIEEKMKGFSEVLPLSYIHLSQRTAKRGKIKKIKRESIFKNKEKKKERMYKESKFILEGEISPQDVISKFLPSYPSWARQRLLTNIVCKIRFSVDRNGEVMPVMTIIKSTGYPTWDEEIKKSLKKWRFKKSSLLLRRAVITFIFLLE